MNITLKPHTIKSSICIMYTSEEGFLADVNLTAVNMSMSNAENVHHCAQNNT